MSLMNVMQAIDAIYRNLRISEGNGVPKQRRKLTEVVRHQLFVAKGMIRANSHDRLVCLHGSKAFGLASGLPPFEFFLKHMEERNNISETAIKVLSVGSWL
jgi:hypothetical protein